MIRTAYALLLIASLLACPFRCAGVVGADVAQASCCVSCVESPTKTGTEQHEQVPEVPSGACECISCLCKGAVLPNDDAEFDAVSAGLWVVDLLPQSNLPQAGDLAAVLDVRQPLCVSSAGRPLRLILQSLQI